MEDTAIKQNRPPLWLIILAIVPLFYVGYPILRLMVGTSTGSMWSVLRNSQFQQAILTSLTSSLCTTLLALCFGVPAAFLMSCLKSRWIRLIEGLLLLPLILPPIVGGVALLNTIGPLTPIGSAMGAHGVQLTDSTLGIIIAQAFITSPFLIFSAKAGFDEVPRELHDAGVLMGASYSSLLLYVYLPLARRGILTGTLLTFARASGEFGASMMVSYHPYSVPVYLWVQFTSSGLQQLIPITSILVVLTIVILAVLWPFRTKRG